MRPAPPVLIPLTSAAADAWLELGDATADLGDRVPCRRDPDQWWPRGDDDVTAAAAVYWCRRCPVVELCRTYALVAREAEGVWGGLTPAERRRATRA